MIHQDGLGSFVGFIRGGQSFSSSTLGSYGLVYQGGSIIFFIHIGFNWFGLSGGINHFLHPHWVQLVWFIREGQSFPSSTLGLLQIWF